MKSQILHDFLNLIARSYRACSERADKKEKLNALFISAKKELNSSMGDIYLLPYFSELLHTGLQHQNAGFFYGSQSRKVCTGTGRAIIDFLNTHQELKSSLLGYLNYNPKINLTYKDLISIMSLNERESIPTTLMFRTHKSSKSGHSNYTYNIPKRALVREKFDGTNHNRKKLLIFVRDRVTAKRAEMELVLQLNVDKSFTIFSFYWGYKLIRNNESIESYYHHPDNLLFLLLKYEKDKTNLRIPFSLWPKVGWRPVDIKFNGRKSHYGSVIVQRKY